LAMELWLGGQLPYPSFPLFAHNHPTLPYPTPFLTARVILYHTCPHFFSPLTLPKSKPPRRRSLNHPLSTHIPPPEAAGISLAMMSIFESRVWKFFRSPNQHGYKDKDELYGTPTLSPRSRSSLPLSDSASSSSSSSISSSTSFWRSSPRQSQWLPKKYLKYLPAALRFNTSKRQITVLICLFLAVFVWFAPPPSTWHRSKARYVVEQQPSSPYQVLRPVTVNPNKHAPDPEKWLEQNSDNKYAVGLGASKWTGVGRLSTKPRAALISLVRNSELEGILQSMRQLEYHWNAKYQYPWIFFNDEPFSDEFRVRLLVRELSFAD
jgi:hypothetical protein